MGGSQTTSGKSQLLVPVPAAEMAQAGTAANQGRDQQESRGPTAHFSHWSLTEDPAQGPPLHTLNAQAQTLLSDTPALTPGTPLQSPAQLLLFSVDGSA